ncbi:hypothetical protein HUX88_29190 [Duganella sp. BJB1802]|uniref:hypothetical protein n=1 Tax=unclassified Duganella TaxID=2636909 RepID=UPI0011C19E05|nr:MULTISPECIES: hypothetical protein [unclassified Duganella]NVD74564.1 hypothetical protein [Duganella sp. BJB1802]
MMFELTRQEWLSLAGPSLAAVVAVVGWLIAHRLTVSRDLSNKRRDLIAAFLLEAYRRLEAASNREDKTEDQAIAFESAIADIQLLGTVGEIEAISSWLDAHLEKSIDQILKQQRDDLRQELGLQPINSAPRFFRFTREYGSGDWQGYPVARTATVRVD